MNLASRGLRDLGTGPESVTDEALADALRARSRGIVIKSLILAGLLTAAVVLWPSG